MYAQIIDGKINPIVIDPEKVEEIRANGITIIDFTKVEIKPQAGWLWDGEKAYAPVEPSKPKIRKIRQDAFLDRFTPTEQGRIEASEDITLRVFKNNAIVVVRPYINLDHGLVQYALPVLRDAGVLDGDTPEERQSRMDAILSDGTEDEAKGISI